MNADLYMQELGRRAKQASRTVAGKLAPNKNAALAAIADGIVNSCDLLLGANMQDIAAAEQNGIKAVMIDRLRLTRERIESMAEGVREVIELADPVGALAGGGLLANGLQVQRRRVPLGVVGIIYESRPNVTVDAAALCLKSGNSCILRGGKEAINTNRALAGVISSALVGVGLPADAVLLVEDTSRECATAMMRLNGFIDVLIPRGGGGLIRAVVESATVPVIETGVGNCHLYIDSQCDSDMAVGLLCNAKCSRPSVCNAVETLLIHKEVAQQLLPMCNKALAAYHTQLRGCPRTVAILGDGVLPATEEDYCTEFNDYILAVRVVDSLDEALEHIARYGTGHSEAIVTDSYQNAQQFTAQVDAAAVYVNASTRFTDGNQLGLGAEIGISTQKLHARGPMGLEALTTEKYVILGSGQVRE